MPLRNAAIALGYVLAGAALAAALAVALPGAPLAAAAVGMAAALAGGGVHLALAGQRAAAALRAEVAALRGAIAETQARQEAVATELKRARDEARQIYAALAEAGRAGGGLKEVMAELQVLQRLVAQVQARQERERAPPPAPPAPAPAAAPAPAEASRPTAPPGERPMLDVVREALSGGRVDLMLQPIVSLPQRRRRFYECFARMRDATGAVVLPQHYLDVAAREGLLPAIDNLLLFRCIQMIRRAKQRSAGVGFFCNVSPHSLADQDFLRDFGDFLDQNRDLAANLILETPQGSLNFEDGDLKAEIDRLAGFGLRFSIDGVTDLPLDYARLAEWHVKFVKVPADRFAGADPEGQWEGSLFQLRRMLGLEGIELIVEGIETDRQLLELLEFNIAYGQGPLFGEPKPAPEA